MKYAAEVIKGMAQDLGVVVFAVNQTKRDTLIASDDVPGMADASYGMALAEASNTVLSFAEKRGDIHQRVWKCIKNRDGEKVLDRQLLRFDVDAGDIPGHRRDDLRGPA